MRVIINPGSGHVDEAKLKAALRAMTQWRRENGIHRWERKPRWDVDG